MWRLKRKRQMRNVLGCPHKYAQFVGLFHMFPEALRREHAHFGV